ncbi:hypothetical protein ACIBEJ_00670 [Nonomuraea sp. NPDC050790]|uniref:hypothetical protein n=1 Tax=Nonomuraea sp. NPDC050790 TaxID=3364371 RepID=UPI00378A8406
MTDTTSPADHPADAADARQAAAALHAVPAWIAGGHGHVIPIASGRRTRCGGPRHCLTCRSEQRLVIAAARRDPNGIDPCEGPGRCRACRRALIATGVNLTRHELPDQADAIAPIEPPAGTTPPAASGVLNAPHDCRILGHEWDVTVVRLLDGEVPYRVECVHRCSHPTYAVVAVPAGQSGA